MTMPVAMQDILDFWFLPAGSAGHGAMRPEWFRKDAQFDALIKARFGVLVEQALVGSLPYREHAGPAGMLARILLLDQFTRNVYRDTPQAFEGDAIALTLAQELLAAGGDLALPPVQRAFVYLPFEHAEDAALQQQSVALFTRLCREAPALSGMLDFAIRHRDVIARFGRFPHRNLMLGRASTPQEQQFLLEPGSSF
jgi:uncharacterized protein (DUF924 family)